MSKLVDRAEEIAKFIAGETSNIDLILAYGSLARGTENAFSDIDLLVISDQVSVSWNFVLAKNPVSVQSMSWDQVTGIAKGIHGAWSTGASIFESHLVLWSKSEDIERRFRETSRYISEGSQETLRRSISNISDLYGQLWRLQDAVNQNDILSPSFLVWNIANGISHILSALNMRPLKYNWGKQLSELRTFQIAPDDFATRYTDLVTSSPAAALPIAISLVRDVENLLKQWYDDQKLSKTESLSEIEDEWSGIVDCLNKVYSARQSQDLVATRYAAVEFAEFAIWLLRTIQGDKSDPKRFKKTPEEIERLPQESQIPLETLLISMELDELVEAGEHLADFLESSMEGEGVKQSIARSLSEAKAYLQISPS